MKSSFYVRPVWDLGSGGKNTSYFVTQSFQPWQRLRDELNGQSRPEDSASYLWIPLIDIFKSRYNPLDNKNESTDNDSSQHQDEHAQHVEHTHTAGVSDFCEG